MQSALLIGLTLGIVAKYVILGNRSSNFLLPALVGVAGAFSAQLLALSTGEFRIDDPTGYIASTFGALLFLTVYYFIARRKSKEIRRT